MHHKFGLFNYGPSAKWVFITSWNFTGGASSLQWNIALEARSATLYAAYVEEAEELLGGRFHGSPEKSHRHDGSAFDLPGSWAPGEALFGPYADDSDGGQNAMSAIVRVIDGAEEQIFFALNKLTRRSLLAALIRAADRGVRIDGVLPRSDTARGAPSYRIYRALKRRRNYAGDNVVRLHRALAGTRRKARDRGHRDLVHCKYMVADPSGRRPVVVHGSANWTASGLYSTARADENTVIVRHGGIARAFTGHFRRMVGMPGQRPAKQKKADTSREGGARPPERLSQPTSTTSDHGRANHPRRRRRRAMTALHAASLR
jgi:phosphatidylserine/phosphatidylglycerophosphate/cardiolipin synthase-like enzyme